MPATFTKVSGTFLATRRFHSGRDGDGRRHADALGSARLDIRQCGGHCGAGRNQTRDCFGRIERCTAARIDNELRIVNRQLDLFRHGKQFRQVDLERRDDVFNARARDNRERRFGAIDFRAGACFAGRIAIRVDLAFGARGLELAFALWRLDFGGTTTGAIAIALHTA